MDIAATMSGPVKLAGTEDGFCDKEECLDNVMKIFHLQKHGEELGARVDDLLEKNTELEKQIESLQHDFFNKDKNIEELKKYITRYDGKLASAEQRHEECQSILEAEKRSRAEEQADLKVKIENLATTEQRHEECQSMLEAEKRSRAEEKADFKVKIENLKEINEQLLRSLAGRRRSIAGETKSSELACVQPMFEEPEEKQAAVSPLSPCLENLLDDEMRQQRSLKEELWSVGISETEFGDQASPTESNDLAPLCDEIIAQNDMAAQGFQSPHRTNTDTAGESTASEHPDIRATDQAVVMLEHDFAKAQQPITQAGARMISSDVELCSRDEGYRSLATPSTADDGRVRGEDKNANHQPSSTPTISNSQREEPGVIAGTLASFGSHSRVSPRVTLKLDDQMVCCPTSSTERYPTTPESHHSGPFAENTSKRRRKRAKGHNSRSIPRRVLAPPAERISIGDRRHREDGLGPGHANKRCH
ncbi:hypothetical protein PMIN02_012934 [Paraphaeosphaeria minitans]